MQNDFKINEHIYRRTTPFKDIFTTVYVLKAPDGVILFDTASYASDVDEYIVPLLQELGVSADMLKYVFISHNHGDHAGGLARFMELYPDTCILSRAPALKEAYANYQVICPEEGDVLLDTFRVIPIPGHTMDSCALLDQRSMTLVTGDCFQLYGILGSGDWASNISYPTLHLEAVEKVRALGVAQIVTAHDYEPCGYRAEGSAEVERMLDACVEPLERLKKMILENPDLDDEGIREKFSSYEGRLNIRVRVVAAMRKTLQQN